MPGNDPQLQAQRQNILVRSEEHATRQPDLDTQGLNYLGIPASLIAMMPINTIAAILGFTGVALGAFGAHALKDVLAANETAIIWQTAVFYHLVHAVASLWAAERKPFVAWLWAGGVVLFSGSLYVLALTNMKWLGAITPFGGILFLSGWAMLFRRK